MPAHPDTPTWGYQGQGPWTKKIFCIFKGPALLGNKWRESNGILFEKKKKDQECSRALWKPTKVGISDPSLSGSFLKTQALLRPHGARGQGDSQRHHNNSLALQMTAENSVFPLSHSRASLFLRISSLKAKKVSFPLSPFVFLGTV